MQKLIIGISMREANAASYDEKRDAIARDWYRFMKEIMPNANWILLPNIEEEIIEYIENWNINAFILTGGENLSISKERDDTEKLIFQYSQANSLPVLGICRGFQAIFKWLGGEIEQRNDRFSVFHVATRHQIIINNKVEEVNSYHSNALIDRSKPEMLKVIGRCKEDNTIEAFQGNGLLGLMWHPEREDIFSKWEARMIKKLFKYE
ncbi:putative glutamine amidotransferase [Christiangramia gaetbulicola]|uniref:Putative glutamine amidotransferase n=1 Tax=Christiangramia gaetbulicola TaxID=703340 RepID=A0A2T6AFL6_9FLAO|nr:gamma-glutamyl-gamma-aminobutyrate hydrolase family protein [Christiangramia gaetbulicola]PTX42613.1 putative glutamine amidotransferase [Christiangramia gaetbulicola]